MKRVIVEYDVCEPVTDDQALCEIFKQIVPSDGGVLPVMISAGVTRFRWEPEGRHYIVEQLSTTESWQPRRYGFVRLNAPAREAKA